MSLIKQSSKLSCELISCSIDMVCLSSFLFFIKSSKKPKEVPSGVLNSCEIVDV